MPNLSIEDKFTGIIAGVDEVGRGPWAGPVVAAAVILDRDNIPQGIDDSKKLNKKKRESLFEMIKETSTVGVGIISVDTIDETNILEATKLAMIESVQNLMIEVDCALVDGNQPPVLDCHVESVIKGDSKSISIAAASIIAKVTRDRIMENLHVKFPMYGWDSNVGYGTKQHSEALSACGITQHHRKSFAPIKKLIEAA